MINRIDLMRRMRSPRTVKRILTGCVVCLAGLYCLHAFAADGVTDLTTLNSALDDTKEEMVKIIFNKGKPIIYAAELFVAICAYISTRKVSVFMGIGVLLMFFNFSAKLISGA